MTSLFYRYLTIMMIVSAVFIVLAHLVGVSRASDGNLLAYTDFERKDISLTLYDVDNRIGMPIGTAGTISGFSLSAEGRLAFASNETGNQDIYLLDIQADKPTTINITQTTDIQEIPLSWSPDGRYLAFVSNQPAKSALYIWDGETAVDITPGDMHDKPVSYQTAWNYDGKLAFTVRFGFDVYQISEIYLWDGETTRSLSQNPNGEDRAPVWNNDGHVAFLSAQGGKFNIFTWGGQSFKNGSPDIQPIMDDPSDIIGYASFPGWTPDGDLTFTSPMAGDSRTQIYVWDGETATDISQNPAQHNGGPQWSNDGRWAFVTLFSSRQLLYVRDSDNRPLLTVEAFQPAWSSNGDLLFCVSNRSGWGLSMWNGSEIIGIAPADVINAHWGNGSGADCSGGQARF